jgi:hypothetical protein
LIGKTVQYLCEAVMFPKILWLIALFSALSLLGAVPSTRSWAQSAPPNRLHRPVVHRPYIVITPAPPLYRRCVDWLELQYRPSGTVLYPQFRCWWVRG